MTLTFRYIFPFPSILGGWLYSTPQAGYKDYTNKIIVCGYDFLSALNFSYPTRQVVLKVTKKKWYQFANCKYYSTSIFSNNNLKILGRYFTTNTSLQSFLEEQNIRRFKLEVLSYD